MLAVAPVTLDDGRVRLEPLGLHHEQGLRRAAADGELWHLRVTSVPEPDDTRGYIERALQGFAEGHRLAFAVLDATSGEVIGCSSYHDIVPAVERLEIGYTWYAKSRQRTHVNASAKLLLMQHAFEALRFHRVEYKTDARNARSRAAIAKLGATQEGIFRKHMIMADGHVRDSVFFSIIDTEWPAVKAGLEKRLGA